MFGTEIAGGAQTCEWNIFRFDNYCHKLIIMDYYMQLTVPMGKSVSKLNFRKLTNFKISVVFVFDKNGTFHLKFFWLKCVILLKPKM